MLGVAIALFLIGGSGITNQHGDIQIIPLAMIAAGLMIMAWQQARRTK